MSNSNIVNNSNVVNNGINRSINLNMNKSNMIVRYDMIVMIEYSLIWVLGWIRGMYMESYYNNILGEYSIYYSMILLVICEVLIFVCLFWYVLHDSETIYSGDNSAAIQFISTGVGSNWLWYAYCYCLTLDTDDSLNDEDELCEIAVNIHWTHLTLWGLWYVRYYWWFVDSVWLAICIAFYY